MKIGISQIAPKNGKVDKNIDIHISIIKKGVANKIDLFIFPELSLTGYEPKLSRKLAFDLDDIKLNIFQELADENEIIIAVGLPLKINGKIYISIVIFQPNFPRSFYCKQILHQDEIVYFAPGNKQKFIFCKGFKIALAICFESLQESHLLDALVEKPALYVASVAKSAIGIEKAYKHFSKMAEKHQIIIAMANCVGFCDNFESNGNSAVWNKNGDLLGKLEMQSESLISFDLINNLVELIH